MTGWGQEPAVKDVEIAAIPKSLCTGLHRLPDRSTVNRQKLVSAAPATILQRFTSTVGRSAPSNTGLISRRRSLHNLPRHIAKQSLGRSYDAKQNVDRRRRSAGWIGGGRTRPEFRSGAPRRHQSR